MATSNRVAVFGATGAIGSTVVSALASQAYDVTPIAGSGHDRYPAVDLRDRSAVTAAVRDVDIVVNAAGLVGIDACRSRPDLAHAVNAVGASTVAWACRTHDVALVHLSTVAAIGNPAERPITAASERTPTTTYGRTKLLGEQAVETLTGDRVPSHTLVIPNVYGRAEDDAPGDSSVLDFFVDRAASGESLPVHRPGTQERDLVHIHDVASAVVAAIDAVDTGEPESRRSIVASGQAYSVLELAGLVASAAQPTPEIELRDHPRPERSCIENFEIEPLSADTALETAPAWTVREWIPTALRAAGDR